MGSGRAVVAVVALAGVAWVGTQARIAATDSDGRDRGCVADVRQQGSWDAEQLGHAATIAHVGRDMDMGRRGVVIALATAMQESNLRNLDHGPPGEDSSGLFQQRPSQGWGTTEQVQTPKYAARAFYRALRRVPGWRDLPLTVAAQSVQRSAYPDAYAKHEPAARDLADRLLAGCR